MPQLGARRLDAFVIARCLVLLAGLAFAAPAPAQDLEGEVRQLLGQGVAPEAAARQLIARGAYPEDVAATLFRVVPRSIRAVAFAVVQAGASADPDAALPLAIEVVGQAPTAAVPAAAAFALVVPRQSPAAAAALSQVSPQAAPLMAAAMASLLPAQAPDIVEAASRAVPPQAVFVAAAVAFAVPAAKPAVLAAMARATGLPPERVAVLVEASEAGGANAVREAGEALAGLPLPATLR